MMERFAKLQPAVRVLIIFVSTLFVSTLFVSTLVLSSSLVLAQNGAPGTTESKPKADVIFIHANVYTGIPATSQFASILRDAFKPWERPPKSKN